jgi:DNA polymerase-1
VGIQARKFPEALNYQDQGTGADIAILAIASLPKPASEYFVNLIHDELLLEVPKTEIEQVQSQVVEAMKSSGRKFLEPFGIDVECSVSIGDCWSH